MLQHRTALVQVLDKLFTWRDAQQAAFFYRSQQVTNDCKSVVWTGTLCMKFAAPPACREVLASQHAVATQLLAVSGHPSLQHRQPVS